MKKLGLCILGFLILLAIYFVCLMIIKYLHIQFPAPILGIIVLFILLQTKILSPNLIKDACNLLLKFMILFFIPLFVGIVKYYHLICENLIPIIFTLFITTFLIMISVGLFFEYAYKYTRLYKIKRSKNNANS